MKPVNNVLFSLSMVVFLFIIGCKSVPQSGVGDISLLKADVEYLASDKLEGREVGTKGEQ